MGFFENCDVCGRFVGCSTPGASWSQQWSYDMSGTPDLHDPKWRCAPCTESHGVGFTNCAPNYPGSGRNPPASPVAGTTGPSRVPGGQTNA